MSKIIQNQVVAVGLSGGVDSSVVAHLLKLQGYEVFGLFMQNWQDEQDPHCQAEQDLSDAKAVADAIGIPLYTVNFAQQYWDQVFTHCLDEFRAGRTPNPDVWCNREIKFNILLQHARKFGADKLATGHYARITADNLHFKLLKGSDRNKDQSYFLYLLNQQQLAHSLFPLGTFKKPQIRAIAERLGLINHAKKDSTGICFIGERKFKTFLKEFILAQSGNMETPDGKMIGTHDGIMFYTIGQRKGLHIGGVAGCNEAAWYVLDKDLQRNVLIVGQGHEHPLLYKSQLHCHQLHWINNQQFTKPLTCAAKTRYRQRDQACTVSPCANNEATVEFLQPQRAITPGQSIVFYDGSECLGGGIIK